jgi:membrane-associated phospholipid phosphatase
LSEIELSVRPSALHGGAGALTPSAQLNLTAWATVLIVAAVDYVWMRRAGFTVMSGSAARLTAGPLMLAVLLLIVRALSCVPRYSQLALRFHFREGCVFGNGLAVMLLFTYAVLCLQNLCVSLAPPVIDNELIALDAALGFHWPDLYAWQIRHVQASFVLCFIYASYTYQVLLTIFFLGIAGRADDLSDFIVLFMASVVTAILISAPFPASNPIMHFGFGLAPQESQWSQFYALRNGAMSVFDVSKGQGLVSMPSLHAADAVLFAYAVRHLRWVFPVSAVFNAVMIYSAIPFGGHYLVDIFAGLLLAVLLILALRRWRAYMHRRCTRIPFAPESAIR